MEPVFQLDVGADPEMHREDDPVALLRETRDTLIRIETLVEVHLGKDGTVPALQRKVDGINAKILLATGVCGAILFLADWTKAILFGK